MKNLRITVNGTAYDVQVEELGSSSAPAAAPAAGATGMAFSLAYRRNPVRHLHHFAGFFIVHIGTCFLFIHICIIAVCSASFRRK